jgi:predicted SAM-dependent methyltransferase
MNGDELKKLDLEGGEYPKKGFINIDASNINFVNKHSFTPDINHDLNEGIPFPDNFIDEVFSSHSMEHFADPKFILREIVRVCKTGAKLEIIVPLHDMDNKTHITEFDSEWFEDNPIEGLKQKTKSVHKKDLIDPLYGDRSIQEMTITFEVIK